MANGSRNSKYVAASTAPPTSSLKRKAHQLKSLCSNISRRHQSTTTTIGTNTQQNSNILSAHPEKECLSWLKRANSNICMWRGHLKWYWRVVPAGLTWKPTKSNLSMLNSKHKWTKLYLIWPPLPSELFVLLIGCCHREQIWKKKMRKECLRLKNQIWFLFASSESKIFQERKCQMP